MDKEKIESLELSEQDKPILIESECRELKPIMREFMEAYTEQPNVPVKTWMTPVLKKNLPGYSEQKIESIIDEIENALTISEDNKASLQDAIKQGRSKESWFASKMKVRTSTMAAEDAARYLTGLEDSIKEANESLYRTITVQAGDVINQNPHLDGFIAEQYHAQTFNMNAAARGSKYRAKVLEPNGNGYAKNSVDIVIVDENQHVVKRYQSKYCKDASATEKAFEHGDYRGQQKLVPEDQQADIQKKSTTVLEAPDGTKSKPLTKSDAERMRDEAQSGNWKDINWNEYQARDLAIGISKQAGYAAVQGAAIGVGFDVAKKLWNGEEIKGEDVVKTAVLSGADYGAKAALSGALKVGAEKGIISVIPKGTPAGTIANIAFVAVEDVKVVGKMMSGELTFKEGIERIEQTTVGTVSGLATMSEGAALGASIGAVLGPVGAAVGGFIGGTIGYMAGSTIGETVMKGVQKIRNVATKVLGTVGSGIKSVASSIGSGIKSFCRGVASFFGF